jgi:ATP:ADP antiporter, AAA family
LRLNRIIPVEEKEQRALAWSFAYFFCLLSSYYVLRPVRDEMGIQAGVQNMQWLFTGTFLAMLAIVPLFGWIATRFPRRRMLLLVYWFFAVTLLAFFGLFKSAIATALVAGAFFIWVSVFNLFVVSVFWSFMADLFDHQQAKRLFGIISAGGSAGAIVGPALTAGLAPVLGAVNLLPVSAFFLVLAIVCVHRLVAHADPSQSAAGSDQRLAAGVLAGVRLIGGSPFLICICLYMLLYTTLSTFLYFEQARIVEETMSLSADRTRLFASMDLAVNVLTLLGQTVFTGRWVTRFGLTAALAAIPLLTLLGFIALALFAGLPVLVGFQVVRRAGDFVFGSAGARNAFHIGEPRSQVQVEECDRHARLTRRRCGQRLAGGRPESAERRDGYGSFGGRSVGSTVVTQRLSIGQKATNTAAIDRCRKGA